LLSVHIFGQKELRFEVLWVFINLASGSAAQTKTVAESGAIPKVVKLLASNSPKVIENAVWMLGNMAETKSSSEQESFFASGAIPAMVAVEKVES